MILQWLIISRQCIQKSILKNPSKNLLILSLLGIVINIIKQTLKIYIIWQPDKIFYSITDGQYLNPTFKLSRHFYFQINGLKK